MNRTAHNIGRTGLAQIGGQHLEPANDDLTPEQIDAAFLEAQEDARDRERDRGMDKARNWRNDPNSARYLSVCEAERKARNCEGVA